MIKNTIAAFITLTCSLVSSSVIAETITIAADIWCPYNCDPNDTNKPGFIVDIAKTIFGANGITVIYREIPWARAKTMVFSNEIQGLIAATLADNDTKNLIFPKEESARMQNTFYTLRSNSWTYQGIKSLQEVKIGVITGYDYGTDLQPYIDKELSKKHNGKVIAIAGNAPLERLIKMLTINRIDVILEDESVFSYTSQKMGFTDYRYAGDDKSDPMNNRLFIAFSPAKKSNQYAKLLTTGISNLRKSGELSRILAKYGLKDWK